MWPAVVGAVFLVALAGDGPTVWTMLSATGRYAHTQSKGGGRTAYVPEMYSTSIRYYV